MDGKLLPGDLEHFVNSFEADENHEHMVFPGFATSWSTTKEDMIRLDELL